MNIFNGKGGLSDGDGLGTGKTLTTIAIVALSGSRNASSAC